jgi:hypothetical protein
MRLTFLLVVPIAFVVGSARPIDAAQPRFDRSAAAKVLERNYDACLPDATPRFPTFTFLPTGEVGGVTDADPTITACIASALRGVRIPTFAGAAVRVSKRIEHGSWQGCSRLLVFSDGPVPVMLDGKTVGQSPVDVRVAEGEHEVTWTTNDGSPKSWRHRFQCGRALKLGVDLATRVPSGGPNGP